jgi:hypothetical protein
LIPVSHVSLSLLSHQPPPKKNPRSSSHSRALSQASMFSGFSALSSISSRPSNCNTGYAPRLRPSSVSSSARSSSRSSSGYSAVHSATAPSSSRSSSRYSAVHSATAPSSSVYASSPTTAAVPVVVPSPTLPRVPRPNFNADRVSQSLSCTMTGYGPAAPGTTPPTSSSSAYAITGVDIALHTYSQSTAGHSPVMSGASTPPAFKMRCARCRNLYEECGNDASSCRFHSGVASRSRHKGPTVGVYTCCEGVIGSPGCKLAHHVEDPGFSSVMEHMQREQAVHDQQAHLERLALKGEYATYAAATQQNLCNSVGAAVPPRQPPQQQHEQPQQQQQQHARVTGLSWLDSAVARSESDTLLASSSGLRASPISSTTSTKGAPVKTTSTQQRATQPPAEEGEASDDKPLDSTDHRVHSVTSTDTLRRLSMMYDVSVGEICVLNGLPSRHESALRARATVYIPRRPGNGVVVQVSPPTEASRRRTMMAWLMDAASVPVEEARFYLDANHWDTRRAFAHLRNDKEFTRRNRASRSSSSRSHGSSSSTTQQAARPSRSCV